LVLADSCPDQHVGHLHAPLQRLMTSSTSCCVRPPLIACSGTHRQMRAANQGPPEQLLTSVVFRSPGSFHCRCDSIHYKLESTTWHCSQLAYLPHASKARCLWRAAALQEGPTTPRAR
jgi:hypothetical protein